MVWGGPRDDASQTTAILSCGTVLRGKAKQYKDGVGYRINAGVQVTAQLQLHFGAVAVGQ